MHIFVFLLFSKKFLDFFSILATQPEQSNTILQNDIYMKGTKRDQNSLNESDSTEHNPNQKIHCTNPTLNIATKNINKIPTNQKTAFLNLFYHGKEVKKTKATISIKKKLK